MKTAKIMDGSLKIQLPSMKSAKNVDENTTPQKIMDGSPKSGLAEPIC